MYDKTQYNLSELHLVGNIISQCKPLPGFYCALNNQEFFNHTVNDCRDPRNGIDCKLVKYKKQFLIVSDLNITVVNHIDKFMNTIY